MQLPHGKRFTLLQAMRTRRNRQAGNSCLRIRRIVPMRYLRIRRNRQAGNSCLDALSHEFFANYSRCCALERMVLALEQIFTVGCRYLLRVCGNHDHGSLRSSSARKNDFGPAFPEFWGGVFGWGIGVQYRVSATRVDKDRLPANVKNRFGQL